MLIGYARASAREDHFELQLTALAQAGCDNIFEDRKTAAEAERHGLTLALEAARRGDHLVVSRLDRLGGSISEVIALVRKFEASGVHFRSIEESIDTSALNGSEIFRLFGALAQLELTLKREQAETRLRLARANGRIGRPKKLSAEEVRSAVQMYMQRRLTVTQICAQFDVTPHTLYRYINDAKNS